MEREFPGLSRKEHIRYFLMYALISAAYSWQLIMNFDKTGTGDAFLQPHYYWWVKTALASFQNPYYTDYIFFPQGANLAFGIGMLPDAILMLPVTLLFGANQAVNSSFILGYLLSGYFAFLLCHDLTGNRNASFIGGLIFAFNPYHVSFVPHQMILACSQWIPFYLLMFRRALLSDNRKWSVVAGFAMALLILTDQLQAIFSVIVTILIIVAGSFSVWKTSSGTGYLVPQFKKSAMKIIIMVVVSAVISSIFLVPAIKFLLADSSSLKISPFEHGGANQFGLDILGFIVPPSHNPIWGALFKPVGGYFLGCLPIVLTIIGVRKYFSDTAIKIVLAITVVSFILSLGITLKYNGQWHWNGTQINLPYYYLYNFTPLSFIRTPYRFHLLTTLGIGILASFGVMYLTRSNSLKSAGKIVPIIGIVIILEFFPKIEKYGVAGPVPKLYQEMAKDKDPYSILILPLSRWTSLQKNGSGSPSSLMYYQTVHGKKIFNGFSSRVADGSLDFGSSLLNAFTEISAYDNYEIHVFGKRSATLSELKMAQELAASYSAERDRFIRDNNIRYIVVHNPVAHQNSMTRLFVETFLGQPMTDSEDGIAYIKVGDFSSNVQK